MHCHNMGDELLVLIHHQFNFTPTLYLQVANMCNSWSAPASGINNMMVSYVCVNIDSKDEPMEQSRYRYVYFQSLNTLH